MLVILLVLMSAAGVSSEYIPPSCIKPVYCDSKLLHHVQTAGLYPDSKTFVDMRMRRDPEETLEAFDELLYRTNNKPTKEQLQAFIKIYFSTESDLETWMPPDYKENPKILSEIRDKRFRQFAKDLNAIWPTLGRRAKPIVFENPELTSFIPISKGFIIPGGRFSELYYWDMYWTFKGLLLCGMKDTVRGIIENLIELLMKLGHVPNGSRWYYQERSEPPLLTGMMLLYFRKTGDVKFLEENIGALEMELHYWLDSHIISFDVAEKTYSLLRYYAPSKGPRPEAYAADYRQAQIFESEERMEEFYINIKSAAESGWDFSSRWIVDSNGGNTGNLSATGAKTIIPVDLNAIFANALQTMAYFESILKSPRKGLYWAYLARRWRNTIDAVLWDEKDGIWYDYELSSKKHRKYFYPSNLSPLWMGAVKKRLVRQRSGRILEYLRKSRALDFPGGIPASLMRSGEQWDFPNAWPPLVSIVVNALEALETEEGSQMAYKVAQTWVRACYKGFVENRQMFEKYDAQVPGGSGTGGEYTVQAGFGWTNGVVFELLAKYGRKLTANDSLSYN